VVPGAPAEQTERQGIQQDRLARSAEYGRHAREALQRAGELLVQQVPGRRPDTELAQAWATVGQGWAALAHAEATRSLAVAPFAWSQAPGA
jgi:hypothetical protein